MKKALALVLALVLALSMAVSAFGLELVELEEQKPAGAKITNITVVDAQDTVLYVYDKDPMNNNRGTTFYVALEDKAWEDIKVTANGNVTAELVEYDPETMEISGMEIRFSVTEKGEPIGKDFVTKEGRGSVDTYKAALAKAKEYNDNGYNGGAGEVTYYDVELKTNVNIIKVVVEKNYTAHFTEGSIIVEAKLDKKDFKGEIVVINDVIIFEYKEVKWTAANFEDDAALYAGDAEQGGYSDWYTDEHGYSAMFNDYNEIPLRTWYPAAVVSTTAFRAIEGEDLLVNVFDGFWGTKQEEHDCDLSVVLYDIVKGQKGVNFLGYVKSDWVDEADENGVKDKVFDVDKENLTALKFGFYGDQIVKGAFEITFETGLDWYELRELFGEKVEEDDIISYYVVDENGKVVGGKEVDYMTADLDEIAEFTIKGENAKLGQYKVVLEVPAAEVGEANPNTGAESVVGVVAALAVVSVATAAAVSLKK